MLNKYKRERIQQAYRRRKEESCHQAIAIAFLDPIHYLSLFKRD